MPAVLPQHSGTNLRRGAVRAHFIRRNPLPRQVLVPPEQEAQQVIAGVREALMLRRIGG